MHAHLYMLQDQYIIAEAIADARIVSPGSHRWLSRAFENVLFVSLVRVYLIMYMEWDQYTDRPVDPYSICISKHNETCERLSNLNPTAKFKINYNLSTKRLSPLTSHVPASKGFIICIPTSVSQHLLYIIFVLLIRSIIVVCMLAAAPRIEYFWVTDRQSVERAPRNRHLAYALEVKFADDQSWHLKHYIEKTKSYSWETQFLESVDVVSQRLTWFGTCLGGRCFSSIQIRFINCEEMCHNPPVTSGSKLLFESSCLVT